MATKYAFKLDADNINLILTNNPGNLSDIWLSSPENNCLLVDGGDVIELKEGLDCRSGGAGKTSIVMLKGASWKSEVGDTGEATVEGTCASPQVWNLISKK